MFGWQIDCLVRAFWVQPFFFFAILVTKRGWINKWMFAVGMSVREENGYVRRRNVEIGQVENDCVVGVGNQSARRLGGDPTGRRSITSGADVCSRLRPTVIAGYSFSCAKPAPPRCLWIYKSKASARSISLAVVCHSHDNRMFNAFVPPLIKHSFGIFASKTCDQGKANRSHLESLLFFLLSQMRWREMNVFESSERVSLRFWRGGAANQSPGGLNESRLKLVRDNTGW